MIQIEKTAWERMVTHARSSYPDECCGAMLGTIDDGNKTVKVAVELENAYQGAKGSRYELRPEDLLQADRAARRQGMDLIGIFHSHPDADAYFSATDLKNSCPWYSFVVLSVKDGEFSHAASFLPNDDQTAADKETLVYPN
jgi:proteasome lid subunit RPN8/RPN11